MPTYEFRCPSGHDFEKFYRSIAAAPSEVTCPQCGKVAARQMSAGGGLVFKGSGFYITDYGKDGKKQQKSPPASTTQKSEASASDKPSTDASDKKTGGETKPAAPASPPSTPAPGNSSTKSPKSSE
jgi:putative FmdB family regulatory protein